MPKGSNGRKSLHLIGRFFLTSWMDVRSDSSILSNSSMQQIPLSARTSAPPSRNTSLEVGSRTTAAVSPTPSNASQFVSYGEEDTNHFQFNFLEQTKSIRTHQKTLFRSCRLLLETYLRWTSTTGTLQPLDRPSSTYVYLPEVSYHPFFQHWRHWPSSAEAPEKQWVTRRHQIYLIS